MVTESNPLRSLSTAHTSGLAEKYIAASSRPAQARDAVEQHGYFEVPGAHLYTVLHAVDHPVARVLLVGAFGSERHTSYVPWVRWARFLAARGVECLRYDYRGVGESTGAFEQMSFDHWSEDVELLAGWLNRRAPALPLVLHGLEIGALLAKKTFEAGIGDALLLWAAPNSANEVLRAALLRRIAVDNMFRYGAQRKSAAEYIRQLENDSLDVDGYQWSAKLWRDSFDLKIQPETPDPASTVPDRPVRNVPLDKSAEPLVKGSTYVSINPDLSPLFETNFQWIATSLQSEPETQSWS